MASTSQLKVGDRSYAIHRLDELQATLRHRPPAVHAPRAARERAAKRRRSRRRGGRALEREGRAVGGDLVCAVARAAAGPDRRACGRRPRRDAKRDGRPRRRAVEDQPADPRRARDRPLRAGRLVRVAHGVRPERRARVRAQPRALPLPALGAEGVQRLPGRAAGHRHLPPGEPRVPRACRRGPRRRRLPRHARRHRLAHDDGQRPRRARLGRRRHRGRGRDARTAALDARPAGRRLQAERRAAGRRDRDRPRPDRDRDAPQDGRRRQVRRVLRRRPRRRCRSPTARRSGTCRPSTARRAASSPSTT